MKNLSKCAANGCGKIVRYSSAKFCSMHLARLSRNGTLLTQKEMGVKYNKKLGTLNDGQLKYIEENGKSMIDKEIAEVLKVSIHKVKYARRKFCGRKYSYGETKKHKAWIRIQAIKKYGTACELCGYNVAIDTHHIVPKYQGGPHEIDNLTVVCPNCHALITRGKLVLNKREDIPGVKREVIAKLRKFYTFL